MILKKWNRPFENNTYQQILFSKGPFIIENDAILKLQNMAILVNNNVFLNTIFSLKNDFYFEINVN